jgi:TRAP-type transport system large permease protein
VPDSRGLRYGIFTPTEAGAVIATYSLAVGLFVYGELKISGLWGVVTEAAVATATVSAANALGYYMTLEQIAAHVASTLTAITSNPLWMLVTMNAFLLCIGIVLESGPR